MNLYIESVSASSGFAYRWPRKITATPITGFELSPSRARPHYLAAQVDLGFSDTALQDRYPPPGVA